MFLTTFPRGYTSDHSGTVGNRLLGMESTLFTGESLANHFGIFIDKYAHWYFLTVQLLQQPWLLRLSQRL